MRVNCCWGAFWESIFFRSFYGPCAGAATPCFPPVDSEPLGTVSEGAIVLHDNWQMREEAIVGDHGDTFSSPALTRRIGIRQPCPQPPWRLSCATGFIPIPIMGMNMMKIPDVNEAENKRYDLLQVQPSARSLESLRSPLLVSHHLHAARQLSGPGRCGCISTASTIARTFG